MFYVVIRELEGDRKDAAAFLASPDAQDAYDEAAHVCDNGPGDGPGDDPAIVTNCWLGWVDTSDPEIAKQSALSGHALIIRACFPTSHSHS